MVRRALHRTRKRRASELPRSVRGARLRTRRSWIGLPKCLLGVLLDQVDGTPRCSARPLPEPRTVVAPTARRARASRRSTRALALRKPRTLDGRRVGEVDLSSAHGVHEGQRTAGALDLETEARLAKSTAQPVQARALLGRRLADAASIDLPARRSIAHQPAAIRAPRADDSCYVRCRGRSARPARMRLAAASWRPSSCTSRRGVTAT